MKGDWASMFIYFYLVDKAYWHNRKEPLCVICLHKIDTPYCNSQKPEKTLHRLYVLQVSLNSMCVLVGMAIIAVVPGVILSPT